MKRPLLRKQRMETSTPLDGPAEAHPPSRPPLVMERLGRIQDMDRSFDLAFRQAQDTTARFRAAWELAVHYNRRQGKSDDELRLQRSVERLQHKPR